jgi:hypothetical protein
VHSVACKFQPKSTLLLPPRTIEHSDSKPKKLQKHYVAKSTPILSPASACLSPPCALACIASSLSSSVSFTRAKAEAIRVFQIDPGFRLAPTSSPASPSLSLSSASACIASSSSSSVSSTRANWLLTGEVGADLRKSCRLWTRLVPDLERLLLAGKGGA